MRIFPDLIGNLLMFVILINYNSGIKWLGLAKLNRSHKQELDGFTRSECEYARKIQVLRKRHFRFCLHHKHRFAMHAVLMASKATVYYCMKTFADRRWNCKSVEKLPKLPPDLKLGTQEQAVVHAFSSAALVFEISRRCSQNKLRHCSCGKDESDANVGSNNQNYTYYYSNCLDNIDIGIESTRNFLGFHQMGMKSKDSDSKSENKKPNKQNKSQIIKRLNGHNYEVGIMIMMNSWKSKCKCHGVSGSCINKICFRQLRRLDDEELLKMIKDYYLRAKHVTMEDDNKLYPTHFITTGLQKEPLKTTDLAFIEHSSDYCEPDPSAGSIGTQGRQCETVNVTLSKTNHCSNMCCGRGYREVMEKETVQCRCELVDVYIVKCKQCIQINIRKFCL
uniref:Protein Wnt n=1 Tax=Schmidtea mediterranea TaxID=79327 RepID=B0LMF9_SCHMD|nr:wnt11-1 [Schmidtea mediterranea]